MKTAKKQLVEIRLPKIQEITLLGNPQPRNRQWNARLRAALAAAGWLLRAPAIGRSVAPDQPALAEHEWRKPRVDGIA